MFYQRCFISSDNNPFFNLATEEYLLKNTEDEIFMLYINDPSVVIGKHQNLLKEINSPWCYKHNIKIARRLSGGGTVYQDHGNINFCFIKNCTNPEKLNYQNFTYPIIKFLVSMGLDVQYSERNDILLKNSKISGNAMHISKNRVLCHGTLLFNSDLKYLSASLKNNKDHYIDKSIKSVPSEVTTISENLTVSLTRASFVEKLFKYVKENLESPEEYSLLNIETDEINRLVKEKYAVWDWIYGYSPKYQFRNQLNWNNKLVEFELSIEKGLIKCINSDDRNIKSLFSGYLTNIRHDYASVKEACISGKLTEHFGNYSDEDFCKIFF